ncbi:hypothetical protein SeLEV6574_g00102 [Synchytrium endobioticum]|uniref:Uncharacterized protein n=1 Tax=Synchytrium endobioticum TaxID=286115 RepID=A0A507DLJ8_9FUNG|nr:hypothetical protein SeLEV6574_g00102 [Synchytrium endobioticum]
MSSRYEDTQGSSTRLQKARNCGGGAQSTMIYATLTTLRDELLLRADIAKQEAEKQLRHINEYGELLKMEKVPVSEGLIDDDGVGFEGAKSSRIEDFISNIEEARRIMDLENAKLNLISEVDERIIFTDEGTLELMTCD